MLLRVAACALDELHRAEAELRRHGLTIVDRFNQRRAHPAAAIARDARSGFLQAVKALGLELPSESPLRTED
jgi:phage terminase small subunit